MTVVTKKPKRTLCKSIALEASAQIQDLCDLNLSLIDAETLKASLYGKLYLQTLEHAVNKLHIELNDVRIKFNKSFLNLFIKVSTKLKLL